MDLLQGEQLLTAIRPRRFYELFQPKA